MLLSSHRVTQSVDCKLTGSQARGWGVASKWAGAFGVAVKLGNALAVYHDPAGLPQQHKDAFFCVVLDGFGSVTSAAYELSLNRNTHIQWTWKAGSRKSTRPIQAYQAYPAEPALLAEPGVGPVGAAQLLII
jgi:hypothetical protein